MIPGRRLVAAFIARLERRLGLPELRAQQGELVGLAQAIRAQADRLEAGLSAGFAAAQDRRAVDAGRLDELDARLARLSGTADDRAAAAEIGLANLGDRVAQLSRTVEDLAGAAGIGLANLGERVARLAETVDRLDDGLTAIDARADADLRFAADQNRRLGEDLALHAEVSRAGFAAIGDRIGDLERSVRSGADGIAGLAVGGARVEQDLVILAGQIRQLGELSNQLGGFTRNLDSNMAQNFAGIGRRLETDLVTLAARTHDLVETSRHVAGTVARLAADRLEARGAEGEPNAPAARTAAPEPAPLVAFDDAGLPAAIRAAIVERGLAPSGAALCLDPARLPRTSGDLRRWPSIMGACRQALKAGERLLWAQPVETEPLIARAEVEQLLGLVGPVETIAEVADGSGIWRVATATRRVEGAAIALRWSLAALEAAHIHLAPLAEEMLGRLTGGKAAHAVDLPDADVDLADWARLLPTFLSIAAREGETPIGVTLPSRFEDAPERIEDALGQLRLALRASGAGETIAFQWVRGAPPIAVSSAARDFARRHGIGFDLTPVSRRTLERGLAAYDDRGPYRGLDFDLRLPSFAGGEAAVVEIPRWSGRAWAAALGGPPARLGDGFDSDFAREVDRLARVFDRAGQKQYELQANLDANLIDWWPDYFVHNWAPPARAWLRLFEFQAMDLFEAASPLVRLLGDGRGAAFDPRLLGAGVFFAAAACAAPGPAQGEGRQLQIDAHGYLSERRALTADTERLIGWMPDRLGAVLELGSGLGLLAERLLGRARLYVGLDLTGEQARAVRAAGAQALVGDFHRLPFADASFDTLLADNVLEHAADPLRALRECHRVLRPGGHAFLIIPPDYVGAGYANEAHLWKADAASVRRALDLAGFALVRQETLRLAELGVPGAFPSSRGRTQLWQAEKPAPAADRAPPIPRARAEDGASPFDLAVATAYWRFAPSGGGKHDTAALLRLPDAALLAEWDEGFVKRFRQYPEEEAFLQEMAAEFAGKRILSIGAGLGLHEIYYRLHGAEVTCCDIVDTNLALVSRVAAAKGAAGMRFIHSSGPDHDLGGPYDVVFVYGSLMTMPEALQRRLAARCLAALAPGGSVILMVYSWAFAHATCGWSSSDQFDARRFARASDPSVGEEHCPWSDWHDEDKLLRAFGGALHVARRQFWNQGWFFWCELRREATADPGAFFAPERMADGGRRRDIDLDALQPVAADAVRTAAGLAVTTADNACGYALAGPTHARGRGANAVLVDADLEQGGLSIGILDVAENRFAFAQAVWQPGPARHLFAFERLPARFQLIVSNHRPDAPGVSRFLLRRLALLDRPAFAAPPAVR